MYPAQHLRDSVSFSPSDKDFAENPYEFYEMLRGLGPIVQDSSGIWLTSHYSAVTDVLKSPKLTTEPSTFALLNRRNAKTYVAADIANNLIAFQDGPAHMSARRQITKVFQEALGRSGEIFREEAMSALAALPNDQEFDFCTAFTEPFTLRSIARFMGFDEGSNEQLNNWSSELFYLFHAIPDPETALLLNDPLTEFREFVARALARRRKSSGDDLLSAMIAADNCGLSEAELIDNVMLLTADGIMNVHTGLASTFLTLVQNRDAFNQIRQAPGLIDDAVNESLRLESPGQYQARIAKEEVEIAGVTIPRHSVVLALLASANRDPKVFAEPDSFRLGRASVPRHLAFGVGRHACIGATMVRIAFRAALEKVFEAGDIGLAPAGKQDWQTRAGHRWLRRLPVVLSMADAIGYQDDRQVDQQTPMIEEKTIKGLLAESAASQPERAAFVAEDGTEIGYTELFENAGSIASALASGNFAKTGGRARIGIVLPNGVDIAVTMLGASITGEAAPFSPSFQAPEYERAFKATRIDVLVVAQSETGPAVSVAQALGLPVLRLTTERHLAGLKDSSVIPSPKPDDIAMVLMTSGSTGSPKIVPLSHRNVCRSARDVAASVSLGPEDRCLLMWEQFHIGGLVDLLLAPLASGGTIIATSGFNTERFFDLLQSQRPTWYQGVPTTIGELTAHAERQGLTLQDSSLRFIRSVAAALPPAVMARVEAVFAVPVIRTLGMTEAGPLITSTKLPPAPQKPGSVGMPAGPEVQIFGDDGAMLDAGETGQVGVRGENVFAGYENNAEANKASFRDGWFLTGDTGYFDPDGDLFLMGRVKELINRGGEKISPSEVDDALASHPAVSLAASFSVPHKSLGEDIAAAVVLRSPTNQKDIRAHLSGLLAAHKIPSRITFLDALPRNPVGKIDRLALAERFAATEEEKSDFAPPRNPTEAFLVSLWSSELFQPHVGIHQEFLALGGDSLSAMRVATVIEKAVGKPLPESVLENFTTIAEIAAELDRLGLSISDSNVNAKESLAGVSLGTEGFEGGAQAARMALATCASKDQLKAVCDQISAYETPSGLLDLFDELGHVRVAAVTDNPVGLVNRARLWLRYRRWQASVRREIATATSPQTWQRSVMNASSWLYSDPAQDASNKALIVGFTGNLQRLMLPTYAVLACLDPKKFDLLLLRDGSNSLFSQGLDGAGTQLQDVADFVNDFTNQAGYARTIALGTSGGGLASVYSAVVSGWDRVIAASPPALSVHAGLGDALRLCAKEKTLTKTEIIIAHADTSRDTDPARQLLSLFPSAKQDLYLEYKTHNFLNEARQAGKLRAVLEGWLVLE